LLESSLTPFFRPGFSQNLNLDADVVQNNDGSDFVFNLLFKAAGEYFSRQASDRASARSQMALGALAKNAAAATP